jgi:hypothetical protein
MTRMQSAVRPVAEFVTADGSALGMSPDFEPPEGAGWASLGPTTGTVKLAVIAAQFPDVPHSKTIDDVGCPVDLPPIFDCIGSGGLRSSGCSAGSDQTS